MSLLDNQTRTSPGMYFPALGGGGGGGSNMYPLVSTIGIDPTFSTTSQVVMNVSTSSQVVNITQPFTIKGGHSYTFIWKANWFVTGTYNSPLAVLRGAISPEADGCPPFLGPCVGQTDALLVSGQYFNMNVSFTNTSSSDITGQFTLETVDETVGTGASLFSSIVGAVTFPAAYPTLVDFGPSV